MDFKYRLPNGQWITVSTIKGDPGKDGRSIVDVQHTDKQGLVDIYTMYFSDDTSFEFPVVNGNVDKVFVGNVEDAPEEALIVVDPSEAVMPVQSVLQDVRSGKQYYMPYNPTRDEVEGNKNILLSTNNLQCCNYLRFPEIFHVADMFCAFPWASEEFRDDADAILATESFVRSLVNSSSDSNPWTIFADMEITNSDYSWVEFYLPRDVQRLRIVLFPDYSWNDGYKEERYASLGICLDPKARYQWISCNYGIDDPLVIMDVYIYQTTVEAHISYCASEKRDGQHTVYSQFDHTIYKGCLNTSQTLYLDTCGVSRFIIEKL